MATDEFLTGLGYLYEGTWLGTDELAFRKVEIRVADIVGTEKNALEYGREYVRVITRTGHIWILFQVNDPRPVTRTPLVSATVVDYPKRTDSQESAVPVRRVLILPPPKKEE